MAAFCILRNVHDGFASGKTGYEQRFNEPFRGAIIPFVAAITFKPSNLETIAQIAKMGKKDRDGIFMGYDQKHGGGYTDNMWVLDGMKLTHVETTDEVHSERVHEKETTVLKDVNGSFFFPVLSGDREQPCDGRNMTRRILKKGRSCSAEETQT